MTRVVFVKKLKADGTPCRKCADVEARLRDGGLLDRIDETVIADERDPASPGMRLAATHGVEVAPFFLVTRGDQTTVYTSYVRVLQEVLAAPTSEEEEAKELMARGEGLDFL